MATAKPRYEPQTGELVKDIQFDKSEVAMLRSIKDDTSFVNDIGNIATVYGCLCRSEADELSAGELSATLTDLKQDATTLAEKLEKIPQSVDAVLWGLSYRRDSPPVMENLKIMLGYLIDEIEGALDKEPGKPGRKRATANWYAANSLVRCFESYGLPITINQWEGSAVTPATSCLELIFASCDRHLSRSAIEEYLKTLKGKK
ncbi:hypothetical protein SAMN05216420_11644 [Nitrosospira sp. Nl5]|uniref:hypothetical protein n=1 Tax=Nitrosospira sp. Nl5 TaxID=200120 RepID=UPI000883E635|nr:hypothetical protein [Nitrosospira sp. Nl5]SCY74986.1 hypothetical protein SAMN05216420_11644 [Nitrosospira sp. Nl5]